MRGGRAASTALEPESFTLDVAQAGMFVVQGALEPYWRVEQGTACVGEAGDWTLVRADRPGIVRVSMRLLGVRCGRAALRRERRC